MRITLYMLARVAALAGCADYPGTRRECRAVAGATDVRAERGRYPGRCHQKHLAAGKGQSADPVLLRSAGADRREYQDGGLPEDVEGGPGQFQRRSAERDPLGLRAGRTEQTLVVVTIMKPVVDGADLLYTYKIVEGTMPANGGTTSLFIDWYGVGAASGRASTAWAWGDAASAGADAAVGGARRQERTESKVEFTMPLKRRSRCSGSAYVTRHTFAIALAAPSPCHRPASHRRQPKPPRQPVRRCRRSSCCSCRTRPA